MSHYNIEPSGINGVLKRVAGVAKGDLRSAGRAADSALDEAVLGYPDSNSPIYHALRTAQARSAVAVRAVASETGFIMGVAVRAATEYIKADDLMASGANHRRAAARDVDVLVREPGVEAKTHQLDLRP